MLIRPKEPVTIPTINRICVGDVIDKLKLMKSKSVHCVITSPPYWNLRNYNVKGQIGLEKTPEIYIEKMVQVFREVKRVLRDDGTVWLNLGSCYNGSGKDSGKPIGLQSQAIKGHSKGNLVGEECPMEATNAPGYKPKDLIPIPWLVAIALQKDGWYLRSDIIWSKLNPMPSSVTDRPSTSHEYVFLLTKNRRYFYDAEAVKEPNANTKFTRERYKYPPSGWKKAVSNSDVNWNGNELTKHFGIGGRNLRSVWTIPTQPFPESHFATFPEKLVVPCIKAGTSEKGVCPECGSPWIRVVNVDYSNWMDGNNNGKLKGEIPKDRMTFSSGKRCDKTTSTTGWRPTCTHRINTYALIPAIVLDPFSGAGTTALVARKLRRNFYAIELSKEYALMSERRLHSHGIISETKRKLKRRKGR